MAKEKVTVPKAVAGIRALRDRLAQDSAAYAEAVAFEREAEAFCQSIRGELRRRRRLKKLDQQELGALIGLTQSAVSRIERNEGDIGLKSIYRYARALGLRPFIAFTPSAEDLLGGVIGEAGKVQRGKELRQVADHVADEQAKLMQSLSEDVERLITRVADAARQARSS
jgi:transcriptional regulator with XRE-family HTH domain